MSKTSIGRFGSLGVLGLLLAACGGGGHGGTTATAVATTSAASLPATFGTGFATDFAASPNSTPAVPKVGDIIPVTLTGEPTPLHS